MPAHRYEASWRDDRNRSWRAPVRVRPRTARTWSPFAGPSPPPIREGGSYDFRVRAVSADGALGDWSPVATVDVPRPNAPGVPRSVEAFLRAGRSAVTWEPPAAGGSAVTGYDVQHRTASDLEWAAVPNCASSSATLRVCALSSATAGETYEFRVRAKSAAGDGPWSAVSTVDVPRPDAPGVPRSVEAFLRAGDPAVTWDPPANVPPVVATGYKVEFRSTLDAQWRAVPNCSATDPALRSCALASGTPGAAYDFRVRAKSAAGDGPWSAVASVDVPALNAPGVPGSVRAFLRDRNPAVTWEPPSNAVAAGVTGYQVHHRSTVDSEWRTVPACSETSAAEPLLRRIRAKRGNADAPTLPSKFMTTTLNYAVLTHN